MDYQDSIRERMQQWPFSRFVLLGFGCGSAVILTILGFIILQDIVIPGLNGICWRIGYAKVCASYLIGGWLLFSITAILFMGLYAWSESEEEEAEVG